MFGTHDIWVFLGASVVLTLIPGPDSLYIVSRSAAHGRRAGIWSMAGVFAGVAVHITAAAVGLSAILASSALAFAAVKLAGAGYLVFLGLQMLLARAQAGDSHSALPPPSVSPHAIFRQGLLTNVLNPKVALFFLAFLPQFVDPAAVSNPLPFFFLGALFVVVSSAWCLLLVTSAAWVSGRLRGHAAAGRYARRAGGALFIGLGLRLALDEAN